jgi:hypothetical protein
MASLGCTVLLRMMSDISRFKAMSSLHGNSCQKILATESTTGRATYKLDEVAFSTCSSRFELEAPNHEDMVVVIVAVENVVGGGLWVAGAGRS